MMSDGLVVLLLAILIPSAVSALLLIAPRGTACSMTSATVVVIVSGALGVLIWDTPSDLRGNAFGIPHGVIIAGFGVLSCLWRAVCHLSIADMTKRAYALGGAGILATGLFGFAAPTGIV